MKFIQYIEKIREFNRYYANVLGKIDQEIYNQPFPLTEARIITEIKLSNGSTATEIQDKLGIDRGYMSRIIQRFEAENIVTRTQSNEDKRQYLLYLTEYGDKIYNDLVESANIGVDKMIHSLSQKEISTLVSSMQTIKSIGSKEDSLMPEVVIRPYQAGDIGYVAQLHGKLYGETYHFKQVFEYYVMKGLTDFMLDQEGGALWIAEVNGENVGSIAITKSSETEAQLRWFVIDDKYQGLGIGNKLINTAITFCKAQNYQHIFLWTVSILEAARHLYGKFNFTKTEEKTNDEWAETTLIEERWDLHLLDKKQQ
ncbi:bifunctional helix-turn-helix transcriptional regulator/GNAT family N-acetyltransferase [Bacillus massiliigorillae]|uniref:bifunctional helix-turn-helix transcriptional regulator/GNAT family N-acetyltransferase n=1 Tax=Bacillus massiliigorillae TaxID=1243664 RepID=UPI0003A23518|nr:helix-turn-helix domain-containing GNAT family N-acetyltransferase [Bacillus massiliigorillae]